MGSWGISNVIVKVCFTQLRVLLEFATARAMGVGRYVLLKQSAWKWYGSLLMASQLEAYTLHVATWEHILEVVNLLIGQLPLPNNHQEMVATAWSPRTPCHGIRIRNRERVDREGARSLDLT